MPYGVAVPTNESVSRVRKIEQDGARSVKRKFHHMYAYSTTS